MFEPCPALCPLTGLEFDGSGIFLWTFVKVEGAVEEAEHGCMMMVMMMTMLLLLLLLLLLHLSVYVAVSLLECS